MHKSKLMRFYKYTYFLLTLGMLLFPFSSFSQQLAFPGAEGFGRFTSGGRGGKVYHVTNLNDAGPGSFRDAVGQPDRIVVFDVGGIIKINERITVSKNTYVAGQTAPGDGITIYGNGIAFNESSGNTIIRYIRIRMGVIGDVGKDAIGISANQNYIFDHVSVSWGRDGTLDINGTGIDNITIQNCIIAQGLHSHSTGGLMQSGKASVIRTLYIDNHTRNPKGRGKQEYINNVVYNWRVNGYILGDTEGLSEANIIGNYFINGPSSTSAPLTNATASFHVYASQNWHDRNKNGRLDGAEITKSEYGPVTFESKPYPYSGVSTLRSPAEAYDYVSLHAGASLSRDAVDQLLIAQLNSLGTQGSIIADEKENNIPGNLGTVKGGIAAKDSDQDGMPNAWEVANGLNPTTDDSKADRNDDGYTNIEEYLSCLVGETTTCSVVTNVGCHGCGSFTTMPQYFPNPFDLALSIHLKGKFQYSFYDLTGIKVINGLGEDAVEIGQELKSGFYVGEIVTESGTMHVKIQKK